jgi:hypothetical protein
VVRVLIFGVQEVQHLLILASIVSYPKQVVAHFDWGIHWIGTAILFRIDRINTKVDCVRLTSGNGRPDGRGD